MKTMPQERVQRTEERNVSRPAPQGVADFVRMNRLTPHEHVSERQRVDVPMPQISKKRCSSAARNETKSSVLACQCHRG